MAVEKQWLRSQKAWLGASSLQCACSVFWSRLLHRVGDWRVPQPGLLAWLKLGHLTLDRWDREQFFSYTYSQPKEEDSVLCRVTWSYAWEQNELSGTLGGRLCSINRVGCLLALMEGWSHLCEQFCTLRRNWNQLLRKKSRTALDPFDKEECLARGSFLWMQREEGNLQWNHSRPPWFYQMSRLLEIEP